MDSETPIYTLSQVDALIATAILIVVVVTVLVLAITGGYYGRKLDLLEEKMTHMFPWSDRTLEDAVAEVAYKVFMGSLGLNASYNSYCREGSDEAVFEQWDSSRDVINTVRLWVELIGGKHIVRRIVLSRGSTPARHYLLNADGGYDQQISDS